VQTFATVADFRSAEGQDLGTSDWLVVDQDIITAFAAATHDSERIHLDTVAAQAQGLDGTIAHGLFTLSLGPKFLQSLYSIEDYSRVFNYGYDRVRFLAPVPVNSAVRMTARLDRTRSLSDGGGVFHITQTFDFRHPDGGMEARPACVAEAVVAYFD
jgi:acyl dehydratase